MEGAAAGSGGCNHSLHGCRNPCHLLVKGCKNCSNHAFTTTESGHGVAAVVTGRAHPKLTNVLWLPALQATRCITEGQEEGDAAAKGGGCNRSLPNQHHWSTAVLALPARVATICAKPLLMQASESLPELWMAPEAEAFEVDGPDCNNRAFQATHCATEALMKAMLVAVAAATDPSTTSESAPPRQGCMVRGIHGVGHWRGSREECALILD